MRLDRVAVLSLAALWLLAVPHWLPRLWPLTISVALALVLAAIRARSRQRKGVTR